jgi:hypothetical protein
VGAREAATTLSALFPNDAQSLAIPGSICGPVSTADSAAVYCVALRNALPSVWWTAGLMVEAFLRVLRNWAGWELRGRIHDKLSNPPVRPEAAFPRGGGALPPTRIEPLDREGVNFRKFLVRRIA